MTEKPVCIIPARGGSKRIPRKNIRAFNGKPLIAWSIETALKSNLFDQVLVSTDDSEIAEVARKYGAEVPFIRGAGLADDHATTAQVIQDALGQIEASHTACCLYPTAPLVTGEDLVAAHTKLTKSNADAVISVSEFDFHPLRAFEIGKDESISFKWPDYALTRSQDLPELLHDAGAFYFLDTSKFAEQGKLVMDNTLGYRLERLRSLDIDTEEDFTLAEMLHRHLVLT